MWDEALVMDAEKRLQATAIMEQSRPSFACCPRPGGTKSRHILIHSPPSVPPLHNNKLLTLSAPSMASVHPSRLGLVPRERDSPDPPSNDVRRAAPPLRIRGRAHEERAEPMGGLVEDRRPDDRNRQDGRDRDRGREWDDGRGGARGGGARDDRSRRERWGTSPERDREREREPRRRSPDRTRSRASPSYAPVAGPPIRLGFDGAPPLGLPPFQRSARSEGKRREERPSTNLEE
jgi:hypothetical protein